VTSAPGGEDGNKSVGRRQAQEVQSEDVQDVQDAEDAKADV